MFTNSEKEVLQTVILKREQTAQELAEANAAEAAAAAAAASSSGTAQVTMNGSNGHLNTGKLFSIPFLQILIFSVHQLIVFKTSTAFMTTCMFFSIFNAIISFWHAFDELFILPFKFECFHFFY